MEAFLKFLDLFVHFKNVLKIEAKLGRSCIQADQKGLLLQTLVACCATNTSAVPPMMLIYLPVLIKKTAARIAPTLISLAATVVYH